MTIVTAVIKNNEICVCSDTQITFGSMKVNQRNHQGAKAFIWGPNICCRAGWEKYYMIWKEFLAEKEEKLIETDVEINDLFQEFWEEAKKRYGVVNYQSDDTDSPWINFDATFMIVNAAGICSISQDVSVCRFNLFHAIGSGKEWALGALDVLYDQDLTAAQIARKAAETACVYDAYCGGELQMFELSC